jgi:hypothetical protein
MIGNLDPTKVSVIVAGIYLTGFAPDGIFNLAWNSDRVNLTIGSQGDGVYVEGADDSAKLTVTLLPTSPSNAHLERLCANRTRFDVTVSDASEDARMNYFGANCRVQKFKDVVRNTQAPTGTWEIILPKCQKIA